MPVTKQMALKTDFRKCLINGCDWFQFNGDNTIESKPINRKSKIAVPRKIPNIPYGKNPPSPKILFILSLGIEFQFIEFPKNRMVLLYLFLHNKITIITF